MTTYYETGYRDGDTYYILNGESVTLVCEYGLSEDQVYDVRWYNSQEDTEVLLFNKAVVPGNELKNTPLEDRDVTWTYTDTSHKLTIPQVNIFTDAIRYRFFVENQRGDTGETHLDLNNKIYGECILIFYYASNLYCLSLINKTITNYYHASQNLENHTPNNQIHFQKVYGSVNSFTFNCR